MSFGMENLLENYGEALQSPPISVESDEPNERDIIQQEETIIIEGEPKRYRPQAGIANFFQQLPKQTAQTSSNRSSNVPEHEANGNAEPKKSSWTDWQLPIQKQKAAQKQKALRAKKGYSDTAERKRKAISSLVERKAISSLVKAYVFICARL